MKESPYKCRPRTTPVLYLKLVLDNLSSILVLFFILVNNMNLGQFSIVAYSGMLTKFTFDITL